MHLDYAPLEAGLDHVRDSPAEPGVLEPVGPPRAAALVARTRDRWALAGDQLYVDLDLSDDNLPPGTRLAIGSAVLEVSPAPHRGCKKFMARFGLDALRFVNSEQGYALHLRGINATVAQSGVVRAGDLVTKLPAEPTGSG